MKQWGQILSVLIAATIVLAGCGGVTKPADKPAPAQGTPAADSGKPQQSGVFVRAVNYGDPGNRRQGVPGG